MERKKKYKLDISGNIPLSLYGILTDEQDIKLSWLINKSLQIKLSRDEDLNWLSRELPTPLAFPVYSDPSSRYGTVRLIKNRTLDGLWIKGYKQVDYLFMMIGALDQKNHQELIEKLQATNNIRGVYHLDPGPLKPWVE